MKNIVTFYIAILLPWPFLYLLARSGQSYWFVMALFTYAIPYRLVTDGTRLVAKNVISRSKVWKLLLPGQHILYFKELYLSK